MEKSGWIVTTSNKYVGYPEEEGIHIMIKSQKVKSVIQYTVCWWFTYNGRYYSRYVLIVMRVTTYRKNQLVSIRADEKTINLTRTTY